MKKLILSTIVALSVAFSCQAKKTELSLHLQQGKSYTQVMNSHINIDQQVQGRQMKIQMDIKGSMTYHVTAVTAAGYDMDVQYDSLSMSMQMPMGNRSFSSESNDPSDIFSSILKSMKNRPFQVKMTPKGKITEVKNLDKLFESMFADFPQLPEQQKAQMKAQLVRSYGEDAFKGNVEMTLAIYPDKPVSKGDTWVVENKQKSGMPVEITTTYTYKADEANDYLITGDSKLQTSNPDQFVENNGMQMKYNMDGTMTSEIRVDKTTGWIKEAKLKQEMQGTTTVKANAQMPNDMQIPMTMHNDMTFTDK
ncbi:DUF6263 family protein [Prolixibacter denitrificans]|uniref:Uncharacterized protein n=1 Tax=Prolixibacter denitrificans TaxID=1541063 RepID=A0A2P8CFM7_9BACT|nr:DUF6263 family protein [Prolixibacter denitrificans]PSK83732.1 hypothetical protein CLV93_103147 [Prolixibacter denitrificans]GET23276.1 hypothetical protein JCM18694_35220 [Prolixibacter denitrificans]